MPIKSKTSSTHSLCIYIKKTLNHPCSIYIVNKWISQKVPRERDTPPSKKERKKKESLQSLELVRG